jgi:hypothetical protein
LFGNKTPAPSGWSLCRCFLFQAAALDIHISLLDAEDRRGMGLASSALAMSLAWSSQDRIWGQIVGNRHVHSEELCRGEGGGKWAGGG